VSACKGSKQTHNEQRSITIPCRAVPTTLTDCTPIFVLIVVSDQPCKVVENIQEDVRLCGRHGPSCRKRCDCHAVWGDSPVSGVAVGVETS
jgi:hypothetical protein